MTDLTTTNILLGIMAFVSLLQAFAVVGVFVAGFLLYRRVMDVVGGIEERQVAPAMSRVNAILDDVKDVTTIVHAETSRIGALLQWLFEALRCPRRTRESRPARPM